MDSARQLRPEYCLLWLRASTLRECPSPTLVQFFDPNQSFTMATMKRKAPEFLDAPDSTPTGRPVKKLRLTQSQKQALIDNLQLESTLMRGVY